MSVIPAFGIIKALLSKHFTRVLLAVVLALSAGNLITYFMYATARQKGAQATETIRQYAALTEAQKAVQEADKALYEGTIKSLDARATKAEAQAKHFKEQNRDLQAALSANPGWRDSPIPDSVLNVLQRPSERRNP